MSASSAIDPPMALKAPRLQWRAIFGGAVAARGIPTMLYALGLSWMAPRDTGSLRPSGIFSVICSKAFWGLFVSLLLGMLAAIAGSIVAGDRGERFGHRSMSSRRRAPARAQSTEVYP